MHVCVCTHTCDYIYIFFCLPRASLLYGTLNLSSLTRDRTHVPSIARRILNHWTTSEVSRDHLSMWTQVLWIKPSQTTVCGKEVRNRCWGWDTSRALLSIFAVTVLWNQWDYLYNQSLDFLLPMLRNRSQPKHWFFSVRPLEGSAPRKQLCLNWSHAQPTTQQPSRRMLQRRAEGT